MEKEVITVSTITGLVNKMPEIKEQAKNKVLFIDKKLLKKLRQENDTNVIRMGLYNMFIVDERIYSRYSKVVLIRKNLSLVYMQPSKDTAGIFIKLAQ